MNKPFKPLTPTTPGDMIRLCRQEKKIDLKEIAKKTGISIKDLFDLETNAKAPQLEELRVIGEAIGHVLHVGYLESGEVVAPCTPEEIELLLALRQGNLARFTLMAATITNMALISEVNAYIDLKKEVRD